MSKHKTRQQKIIAQLHRKLEMQQDVSSPKSSEHITYSYRHVSSPASTQSVSANTSYIRHDLIKTLMVTAVIIFSQLFLYYALRTHMIPFPIGGY